MAIRQIEPTRAARAVSAYLSENGITLTHTQALEVVARSYGCRNYQVLKASVDGEARAEQQRQATQDAQKVFYEQDYAGLGEGWYWAYPSRRIADSLIEKTGRTLRHVRFDGPFDTKLEAAEARKRVIESGIFNPLHPLIEIASDSEMIPCKGIKREEAPGYRARFLLYSALDTAQAPLERIKSDAVAALSNDGDGAPSPAEVIRYLETPPGQGECIIMPMSLASLSSEGVSALHSDPNIEKLYRECMRTVGTFANIRRLRDALKIDPSEHQTLLEGLTTWPSNPSKGDDSDALRKGQDQRPKA